MFFFIKETFYLTDRQKKSLYVSKSQRQLQNTQVQGQGGGGQTDDIEISIETFEDEQIKIETPQPLSNKKEVQSPHTPPEIYAPLEQATNRSEIVENMFTGSIADQENLDAPSEPRRRSIDRAQKEFEE